MHHTTKHINNTSEFNKINLPTSLFLLTHTHTHTQRATYFSRVIYSKIIYSKNIFLPFLFGKEAEAPPLSQKSLKSLPSLKSLKNNHASTSLSDRKMISRRAEIQSISWVAVPSKRISITRSLSVLRLSLSNQSRSAKHQRRKKNKQTNKQISKQTIT